MRKIIMTGLAALALATGASALALPAGASAATAAHHSHPTQILVKHQAKRITCPVGNACDWSSGSSSGGVNTCSGNYNAFNSPVNSWVTIPSGFRDCIHNKFTAKVVWLHNPSAGLWNCLPENTTVLAGNIYTKEYFDTRDSCSNSRPSYP